MSLIIRLLANTVAILLISYYMPGVSVDSFTKALIAAVILGLVNAVIRPILMLLSMPIRLMTLGLFTFIINALMVWLVSYIVDGFEIDGFTTAIVFALLMWLVSLITSFFIKKKKKKKD
ncbi:MAG: phage holin family protein [bacterium]